MKKVITEDISTRRSIKSKPSEAVVGREKTLEKDFIQQLGYTVLIHGQTIIGNGQLMKHYSIQSLEESKKIRKIAWYHESMAC